jgi:hypothetical protein
MCTYVTNKEFVFLHSKHVPTKPDQEKMSPIKYTPFEQQIIDLKSKYPGMILLVESGYKYRFFGEDAKVCTILKI